jgi:hypothetical protein
MAEGWYDTGELVLFPPITGVMTYTVGELDPFPTTTLLPLEMNTLTKPDELEREAKNQPPTNIRNYWTFGPFLPDPVLFETTPPSAPLPGPVELGGTTPPPTPRWGSIDLPDPNEEPQYMSFSFLGFQLVGIPDQHLPATELVSDAPFLICSKYSSVTFIQATTNNTCNGLVPVIPYKFDEK